MAFIVRLDPEAIKDLRNSINWYESKRAGLGQVFRAQVKSCINGLKTHPFFAIRYKDVRMLQIGKFPYALHFTVDEEKKIVTIWGLIGSARDPIRTWVWQK